MADWPDGKLDELDNAIAEARMLKAARELMGLRAGEELTVARMNAYFNSIAGSLPDYETRTKFANLVQSFRRVRGCQLYFDPDGEKTPCAIDLAANTNGEEKVVRVRRLGHKFSPLWRRKKIPHLRFE